jgi:hypothetical protein
MRFWLDSLSILIKEKKELSIKPNNKMRTNNLSIQSEV